MRTWGLWVGGNWLYNIRKTGVKLAGRPPRTGVETVSCTRWFGLAPPLSTVRPRVVYASPKNRWRTVSSRRISGLLWKTSGTRLRPWPLQGKDGVGSPLHVQGRKPLNDCVDHLIGVSVGLRLGRPRRLSIVMGTQLIAEEARLEG